LGFSDPAYDSNYGFEDRAQMEHLEKIYATKTVATEGTERLIYEDSYFQEEDTFQEDVSN
jgi:hypothetical protein